MTCRSAYRPHPPTAYVNNTVLAHQQAPSLRPPAPGLIFPIPRCRLGQNTRSSQPECPSCRSVTGSSHRTPSSNHCESRSCPCPKPLGPDSKSRTCHHSNHHQTPKAPNCCASASGRSLAVPVGTLPPDRCKAGLQRWANCGPKN